MGGIGGERGGAVCGAESVKALGDFGVVHFGSDVERGVRTVKRDARGVGQARRDEARIGRAVGWHEERRELAREVRVGDGVDRGRGVEQVDVAGCVRHDCDALVLERAAGLLGDDGTVCPHGLRDEAAVVREDAGIYVEEVLGVEGRGHEVDAVERQPAHHERGGGVESGE